jgi:hypothetical protein
MKGCSFNLRDDDLSWLLSAQSIVLFDRNVNDLFDQPDDRAKDEIADCKDYKQPPEGTRFINGLSGDQHGC